MFVRLSCQAIGLRERSLRSCLESVLSGVRPRHFEGLHGGKQGVDLKEFQKAEVMVAPALQTEGKFLQKSQGVGMGH